MTAVSSSKDNGKCLLENWIEKRAAAVLDTEGQREHIRKYGHRGILTTDLSSKFTNISTVKESFIPPKGSGVRQRGIRSELVEKLIKQTISEQTHAEFNPKPPKTEYCSTTKHDFRVTGFVHTLPERTKVHDYKTDQAITFYGENYQHIQCVTLSTTSDTPFKKNASFSTPISEQMNESVPFPQEN